jgi:DNA-binding response OmpR family regulator
MAILNDERLDLTPTEFHLLQTLSGEPGIILDYIALVQSACGYSCTRREAQEIIGTHIRNLRQKLGVERGCNGVPSAITNA